MWLFEAKRNVNNINILLGKIRTEAIKLIAQSITFSFILGIIKSRIIITPVSASRRPPSQVGLPMYL
jgi:hypothetical protein